MKARPKTILSVLFMIITLASASYCLYRLVNTITEVQTNTIFRCSIQGIFGENATLVNGSWHFTPLAYATNSFEKNLQETDRGFTVNITLSENWCVFSKSFWFWANATVLNFNCTIYSNSSEVFFIEEQSNILEFDFSIFSTDMQIISYVVVK